MCSNDDLKEIGIPMGPRKKLVSFISEWSLKMKQAQVRMSYSLLFLYIFRRSELDLLKRKLLVKRKFNLKESNNYLNRVEALKGLSL